MAPTHYEVLGVAITASPEESAQTVLALVHEALTLNQVRRAYKQKALETHPDKCIVEKAKRVAQAKFCRIREAFEVLSDEKKRQIYDASQRPAKSPTSRPSSASAQEDAHRKRNACREEWDRDFKMRFQAKAQANATDLGAVLDQAVARLRKHIPNRSRSTENDRDEKWKRHVESKREELMKTLSEVFEKEKMTFITKGKERRKAAQIQGAGLPRPKPFRTSGPLKK